LREKLCEVVPNQYNHHVALYGLGGVGKTETAVAYVYAHKRMYEAIYWIRATNQADLFSSFHEIAETTGRLDSVDNTPLKVAKSVLLWLQRQDNWLVVIDNLGNPKISAKGLEIGVLGLDEAKQLLILKSNVKTVGQSSVG
jgi:hypothetical protein